MKLTFGIYEAVSIFPMGKVLSDIVQYLQRSLNLTDYEEKSITAEDTAQFTIHNLLKENVDVVMIPYTTNGGWDYKYYKYTPTIVTGDAVIWAGPPLKFTETSFSRFYVFDTTVTLFFVLTLICVCLIGSLIKTMVTKKRKKQRNVSIYGFNLIHHLWFYFWSCFRVAILIKLKSNSYRILLAFWLMIIMILSIHQSCSFTAQMSFSTFLTIEEFEDIKYYEEAVPKVYKDSIMDKLFEKKVRSQNLLRKKRYYEFDDFTQSNYFDDINDGKIIIVINDFYINSMASFFLESYPQYSFQISPSQGPVLQSFLMSNNLSSIVRENISSRMARIFASKTYDYVLNPSEMYLFLNSWQPPTKEPEPPSLKFRDLYIVFRTMLIGQAVSIILVIAEAIMKLRTQRNTDLWKYA